jgi:predicted deacetylase
VLIVAVHDVAPSTIDQVRWLLGRLDEADVRPRVLKVIPAEPGASEAGLAELASLIAQESAAGSEIVLHGWSHEAAGRLRGSWPDRLRAALFAGGAAEFLALAPDEIGARLAAGRERLAGWGAIPDGFCPPAWLATDGLAPAARAAGFRYLVTLRGLRDLERSRWLTLPPIGFMGAGPVQEMLVGVAGTMISGPMRRLLRRDLARVFLHPQGARQSAACGRMLARVATLGRMHEPTTYRALLDG